MRCTLVLTDQAHKRFLQKLIILKTLKLQVFLESILHSICHTKKKFLNLQ